MKHKILTTFILSIYLMMSSGCAAVMALKSPGQVDTDELHIGMHRMAVINLLGQPASVEKIGDESHEMYRYVQGYHPVNKGFRFLFHLAADVFTLFLWELLATPGEMLLDGKKKSIRVVFDAQDEVIEITPIVGG